MDVLKFGKMRMKEKFDEMTAFFILENDIYFEMIENLFYSLFSPLELKGVNSNMSLILFLLK